MCLPFMDEVFGFQAGIMEEMLEDTMETLDDDELEEEADSEVEKVLYELTAGKIKLDSLLGERYLQIYKRNMLCKNTGTGKEPYFN